MEHHHAVNGKTHYQWPFSIAILNYRRVNHTATMDPIAGIFRVRFFQKSMLNFSCDLNATTVDRSIRAKCGIFYAIHGRLYSPETKLLPLLGLTYEHTHKHVYL